MSAKIELVYFEGCPHAAEARARLRVALAELAAPIEWAEWDTDVATTPEPYRRYGSPTVLVNGKDVAGGVEASGRGCVVGGAPSVATIVGAIREAGR
jgi:mercuric ion transport protein